MYKNQLQELAQRSCFNLPSYACVREGPDHAPRFRASVNFNGEIFLGPSQCTTLRQAEHAAAEVALTNLSSRAPSRSLAARVLDETGVYKNLLQETTHRAGLKLPIYTTVRSGPGHQPVFTSTVELAGMCITGDSAKTKKQAEKNAAMAAWSALKQMPDLEPLPRLKDDGEGAGREEQEQLVRYLSKFKPKEDTKLRQQMHKQGKKIGVCLNEGTSSSYSSPHSSLLRFQHQWRSLEQQQKKSSFLTPQILSSLLFTLNSPVSSQDPFSSKEKYNSVLFQPNSQDRSKKIPTLLDCNEMTNVQAKPSCFHRFTDQNSSIFSSREFSLPPSLNIPIEAAQRKNSSSIPIPRMLSTGGFQTRGIAPAVQIRSVIPVCAAPPPMRPPPPSGSAHPVDISVKEKVDDFTATSKLSSLQL